MSHSMLLYFSSEKKNCKETIILPTLKNNSRVDTASGISYPYTISIEIAASDLANRADLQNSHKNKTLYIVKEHNRGMLFL